LKTGRSWGLDARHGLALDYYLSHSNNALPGYQTLSHWDAIAWWVGINIAIGVFGPLLVGRLFVRYTVPRPAITLRHFYKRGELGLVSLVIALGVILDARKANYSSPLRDPIVYGLLFFGGVGAYVWAVPLCHDLIHVKVDWNKVWRESWRVSLMVFSIALVAEILLELAS
jgi:hypothetical protein